MITSKICVKCTCSRTIQDFWSNRATFDGLQSWCKNCLKKNASKLYKEDPKLHNKRASKWKLANPQRWAWCSYTNGARVRNIPFELTFKQFKTFWQKPCWYCSDPIETIGLDRKDNSKGYTSVNIVACCTTCNRMKKASSLETFLSHITKIYSTRKK